MKRFKHTFVTLVTALVLASFAVFGLAGCDQGEPYKPSDKTPTVTPPTIGQAGTLRVGVDANNRPLAGVDSGKLVGFDVDAAAQLADALGLKLVVVDVGGGKEAVAAALSSGRVDIVMG
ncbi:MAG: transporter substrate-binding domain-containing protein, partial [Eggerthellaceae bacterium]|nr:transporter substrate-binding domain-containing protein [Eggerthellaceae bacterium]